MSIILADGVVLFDNIPETSYKVGGKTPLEWVVDRYKITADRDGGITNDPYTGIDIIIVIERVVYVGMELERIIMTLPNESEPITDWKLSRGDLDAFS